MKIIRKAKLENRQKGLKVYYENHHILPRSLFPNWIKKEQNLVLLTAREHFFCHQLLVKIYPTKEMINALWLLVNTSVYKKISSKEYEKIKVKYIKLVKERQKGKIIYLTKEQREKAAESLKRTLKNENPIKKRERLEKIKLDHIGRAFFNDGEKEFFLKPEDGFKKRLIKGRLPGVVNKKRADDKRQKGIKKPPEMGQKLAIFRAKTKAYNDGIKNYFLEESDKRCLIFKRGWIKKFRQF
jgi:hypothetical protein